MYVGVASRAMACGFLSLGSRRCQSKPDKKGEEDELDFDENHCDLWSEVTEI